MLAINNNKQLPIATLFLKCFYDCGFVKELLDRRILRATGERSFISNKYQINKLIQNNHKALFI